MKKENLKSFLFIQTEAGGQLLVEALKTIMEGYVMAVAK
jgi:hypothetical protein